MCRITSHFWFRLLILLLGWRFSLFLIQLFTIRGLSIPWSVPAIAFQTFGLWDGYWHTYIARFGYDTPGLTLRFPLYPLLIRLFAPVFLGSELAASQVLSLVFFFLAMLWLYRLGIGELRSRGLAWQVLLFLLVFPTSFFFAAAYGESMFLFLTVVSFWFFRRDRFIPAGLFGGLAALTRLQGLLLFPSFLIEIAIRKRQLIRQHLALFLIPLALLPWCWFLWDRFGDPLLFLRDLSKWGEGPWQRERALTSPLLVLGSYFSEIPVVFRAIAGGLTPLLLVQLKELSDLSFFLLFLFLTMVVFRRLRLSYGMYQFLSLVMMLSVGTLKGAPRFVLVLFPSFLILPGLLRRPWVALLVLSLSVVVLVWFLLLFSLHFWIA